MKGIVYSCCHADPRHDNDRALWLGKLIYDERPDVVIDLGDGAEMNSLCVYDKAGVAFTTYADDIEAYHDFQKKLRYPFKKNKRKLPYWIGLEGNHEFRIKKAILDDPRREGAYTFKHLETDRWFNEYHEYKNAAPAIMEFNGTLFAHFFSSGNYGTAMSNIHLGYQLVLKNGMSSFMGHTHKRSHYMADGMVAGPAQGVNVGCMIDYEHHWAGQANKDWWAGCCILHNWEDGKFDLEWASLKRMRDHYERSL